MSFKDFYLNTSLSSKKHLTEEDLFYDVVKIKIPSLKSFIAWLVLKNIIKPYIKESKKSKPIQIDSLSPSLKINFLVKNVKNLKELATYFSNTFKK